jgi:acyl dehydratase
MTADTATAPRYDDIEVGSELPAQTFTVRRADLVRYAGASGDFNVIHWNERVARAVGLPDVIAHGMFTMALAARVVTDWAGDPGRVVEYGVRFTRPVPVPDDDDGAQVEVTAAVAAKLDDRRVRVDLMATHGGAKVLGRAQAVVDLTVVVPA